jgi:hypothetical protein
MLGPCASPQQPPLFFRFHVQHPPDRRRPLSAGGCGDLRPPAATGGHRRPPAATCGDRRRPARASSGSVGVVERPQGPSPWQRRAIWKEWTALRTEPGRPPRHEVWEDRLFHVQHPRYASPSMAPPRASSPGGSRLNFSPDASSVRMCPPWMRIRPWCELAPRTGAQHHRLHCAARHPEYGLRTLPPRFAEDHQSTPSLALGPAPLPVA